LGDIKIATPSGNVSIPNTTPSFQDGVSSPSNGIGGVTREDLPPIERNRTESIQQDWGELDRYGGQFPPELSPDEIDAGGDNRPESITTDAWADAWPQTQLQADENRIAQGTISTFSGQDAFSALSSGFDDSERRRQVSTDDF
jgi:hypothetical protein